jgi:hypothetical protein
MSPQLYRNLRALMMLVAGLVLVASPFMKLGVNIVTKSCSPPEYAYDAFAPYCAATIQARYPFKSTCAIHVIKQVDDIIDGYGVRQFIAPKACREGATKIEWMADNVTVTTPDGPTVIPKDDFIGGR